MLQVRRVCWTDVDMLYPLGKPAFLRHGNENLVGEIVYRDIGLDAIDDPGTLLEVHGVGMVDIAIHLRRADGRHWPACV